MKKKKPNHPAFKSGIPKQKKAVKSEKTTSMEETTITTEQKVNAHITPETAGGQPAPVDGVPVWSLPNGGDLPLEPAADGMSCFCVSGSTIGDVIVQVDADADLGSGVVTISKQFTVHVISPMASQLVSSFDEPIAK